MTDTRAPSEKQIAMAERLAEKKNVNLPEGYAEDVTVCRAFIDEHVAPSEKQVNFANKLAEERGVTVPEDALKDGMKLSRWIDEALKTSDKGKKKS